MQYLESNFYCKASKAIGEYNERQIVTILIPYPQRGLSFNDCLQIKKNIYIVQFYLPIITTFLFQRVVFEEKLYTYNYKLAHTVLYKLKKRFFFYF